LRHYILINSGSKENNYGTGFMVSKGIKQNLICYKIRNERIYTVRMRGRFFNMTFISIHAPTEEKEEDIKDEFYERLERTCDEIPRNDIKIIVRDFIAKIGKEVMYRPAIGTHSRYEKSNENGQSSRFHLREEHVYKQYIFPIQKYPQGNMDISRWWNMKSNRPRNHRHETCKGHKRC
jgi:hypothetical protein